MHLFARFSLKNRALIALVTVVAAVFGVLSMGSLKQELMPSVQFPTIAVVTSYPGASPEVVNNDVTGPIETALRGVPGLETSTGTSSTGASMVLAQFTYGVDLAATEQKVERAISRIARVLPSGVEPQVASGSFDDFPVIHIAVTPPEGTDTEAAAQRISQVALPELTEITGVREAQLYGSRGERVTITLDSARMSEEAVSAQAVTDALQRSGVLMAAGTVSEGDKTLAVQAGSKLTSVDEIAALPVVRDPALLQARVAAAQAASAQAAAQAAPAGAIPGGAAPVTDGQTLAQANADAQAAVPTGVITVSDVATVQLEANPVQTISRVNGAPALTIAITKLSSANTVEVSRAVHDALPSVQQALEGSTLTVVFDQAPYIERSVESLTTEGLLGLAFAILVILVFLLSVRATIVTAISIPVSVLLTFIGLNFAEYTLNMLTLGALTISIGRVVDDSIVVIENIKRHLGEQPAADRARTIVEAVREVAGAITASTVTTVAVFLPLAFVSGMVGELFRPFAFTVAIALAASLLVALTIVPVLAYWFLPAVSRRPWARAKRHPEPLDEELVEPLTKQARQPQAEVLGEPLTESQPEPVVAQPEPVVAQPVQHEGRITALQRGYRPILSWTLKHPAVTLLLAVLVFGGTIAATPLMKTNFIGNDEQNSVGLTQAVAPGTSLDAQLAQAKRVEEALSEVADIETVQVSIGAASGAAALFGGGGDGSIRYSITTDPASTQSEVQGQIRAVVDTLEDAGEFSLGSGGGGIAMASNIEVTVTAPDQATLKTASEAVIAALKQQPGLLQVESDLSTSRPYLSIVVDRQKASELGLTEAAVASLVAREMQPSQIGQIALNDTNVKIYLSQGAAPADAAGVAAIELPSRQGEVRLDSIAAVEIADGPVSVSTENGNRTVTVSAQPKGDNLAVAGAEVSGALASLELPAGATAKVGGVMSQQTDAFSQLGIALLIAILIVYVVMVATFRSLLQPLLLLISVPFAATGALLLLIATGIPLGVASLIGVLMLIGIVVTNAIVLIDLVNQMRERGEPLEGAVLHGASLRLRPIVMTALATILALVPMGIGVTGGGGFISQPLAVVVIGGLLSSTVLTLVVLPTLYFAVERRRERARAHRAECRARRSAAREQRSASVDGAVGPGADVA